MLKFHFLVLSFLILFSLGIGVEAFAEKTYVIKIPSGASDPNAPFFWSEKSTGVTTGEITIYPNDSIRWENADTAFHTVTSVTREGEVDGLFDSGFFTAGESYTRKFTELGDFYYFCSIHPWMNGIVHVIKDPGHVQTIKNVGSGLSESGIGYDVKYILDKSLQQTVVIDSNQNTLTFRISGDTQNEQITIILPSGLIENPNTVWVDGTQTDFDSEDTSSGKKLIIPILSNSKEIKIMGTHVIPEFGLLAIAMLSIGVMSVVLIVRSKIFLI